MCDFKPGDEVVCVDATAADALSIPPALKRGATYVVVSQGIHPGNGGGVAPGTPTVFLAGVQPDAWNVGYLARRFRKVQRRNIEAWLETATDFEEPKRAKEPAQ